MSRMSLADKIFTDANGKVVPYDGSPLSWRISAYSVIIENNQVFLIKSKDEELYDLPGGGVEIGESVENTLKREAQEEAGLKIKVGSLISYHQDYFYHRKEKRFYQTLLLYFRSKITTQLEKPSDPNIEFAQFVDGQNLDVYPMLSYVREIIDVSQ